MKHRGLISSIIATSDFAVLWNTKCLLGDALLLSTETVMVNASRLARLRLDDEIKFVFADKLAIPSSVNPMEIVDLSDSKKHADNIEAMERGFKLKEGIKTGNKMVRVGQIRKQIGYNCDPNALFIILETIGGLVDMGASGEYTLAYANLYKAALNELVIAMCTPDGELRVKFMEAAVKHIEHL